MVFLFQYKKNFAEENILRIFLYNIALHLKQSKTSGDILIKSLFFFIPILVREVLLKLGSIDCLAKKF